MEQLESIIEQAQAHLEAKNQARDEALSRSRELIRHCARAIRAVHRGEMVEAEEMLVIARQAVQRMVGDLAEHADLYNAGYTQDALKEYVEATITHHVIAGEPLPTPDELVVLPETYLNGLAEAMGELRRYILDVIRHGKVERCERLLRVMEDVYSALVTIDYPDSLTKGLRRKTDMVRGVLERTRGDLTLAARQDAMQAALLRVEQQIRPTAAGGEAEPGASELDA